MYILTGWSVIWDLGPGTWVTNFHLASLIADHSQLFIIRTGSHRSDPLSPATRIARRTAVRFSSIAYSGITGPFFRTSGGGADFRSVGLVAQNIFITVIWYVFPSTLVPMYLSHN